MESLLSFKTINESGETEKGEGLGVFNEVFMFILGGICHFHDC